MQPLPNPARPLTTAITIGLLALLLVGGLTRLFSLRFSSGEIYPAYSTLRADPLGAKLLYQSLKQSRFLVSVERHFTKLDQIDCPPDTTFVMLAAEERFDDSHDRIERGMASALFGVMNAGGRVASRVLICPSSSPWVCVTVPCISHDGTRGGWAQLGPVTS